MIRRIITYIGVFVLMIFLLVFLPGIESFDAQTCAYMGLSALLFVLLVFLSCRLVGTGFRPEGIICTALFLLFFLPGVDKFFSRDIRALIELGSQCIVPFFISQYHNVSRKSFSRIYVLMLLMGIFCSYTHDGITIPLCAGFLWMSLLNRSRFFRTACWPMVIGFLIGTGLSIWNAHHQGTSATPSDLKETISQTTQALLTLWYTKIFLLSVGLTAYLSVSRWGRRILLSNFQQHTLLSCCAMFSYCTLPFAPLGLENAVTGVCFFCMLWTLLLVKALANKFYYVKSDVKDE